MLARAHPAVASTISLSPCYLDLAGGVPEIWRANREAIGAINRRRRHLPGPRPRYVSRNSLQHLARPPPRYRRTSFDHALSCHDRVLAADGDEPVNRICCRKRPFLARQRWIGRGAISFTLRSGNGRSLKTGSLHVGTEGATRHLQRLLFRKTSLVRT